MDEYFLTRIHATYIPYSFSLLLILRFNLTKINFFYFHVIKSFKKIF